MAEEQVTDEIKDRYDGTSKLRQAAIEILAENKEILKQTLFDKDTSKVLIKLLDGEDKQTIARQKNATEEKMVGVVGSNINTIADAVIQGLGGMAGIRGEPDAAAAPKENVPIDIKVDAKEMQVGEDPECNYENIMKQGQ